MEEEESKDHIMRPGIKSPGKKKKHWQRRINRVTSEPRTQVNETEEDPTLPKVIFLGVVK